MMTREIIREAVCLSFYGTPWEDTSDFRREICDMMAREVLAALDLGKHVIVSRKLLTEAHACMRETGWHLANTCNYSGDGVLEAACSDVEARMGAVLKEAGR